ncbi:hypothetical protein CWI80_04020 [Pseudidiomarina sediminum]|uniref:Uncharacterized protein n=1 Tax=Pseudidiomarina sediminum TaxID=431675 RepID=A0A432Z9B2_9GAMM|nr:hypothetical protein [Pseudidiomarina sediminum]RUO74517.1 hypothetical protein CWI80_04020 [Pseudidiomarina sediminum]
MGQSKVNFFSEMFQKPPTEALLKGAFFALMIWLLGAGFEYAALPTDGARGNISADSIRPMIEVMRGFLNMFAGLILLIAVLQYVIRAVLLKK